MSKMKKRSIGRVLLLAFIALLALCTVAVITLILAFPSSRATDILVSKWIKTRDDLVSSVYDWRNPVRFRHQKVEIPGLERPTSLQFGPDGKLYVAAQHGLIFRLTMTVDDSGHYRIGTLDTITLVRDMPNRNDDGLPAPNVKGRQVTGLLVTGSADHPVLFVTSSDPRMTGSWEDSGTSADGDLGLDTNSGIVSELDLVDGQWVKTDLVRGLPRSEENHSINGLTIDPSGKTIYLAVGGNTNAGAPSKYFGYLGEYVLSSAILRIDLDRIRKMPVVGEGVDRHVYDLPTLNAPNRADSAGMDIRDPFGGEDGLNQARLDPTGPVTLAASGFRNPYDVVLPVFHSGKMYTIDNGADESIGGFPVNMGTPNVSNQFDPAQTGAEKRGWLKSHTRNRNTLHAISLQEGAPLYYGGHPVPIRANPLGAGWFWRDTVEHFSQKPTTDWPPAPPGGADLRQGDYLVIGASNPGLTSYGQSTNGIDEYTSGSFFNGALQGDLMAASFDGCVFRIKLNAAGDKVLFSQPLSKGFALIPLDLVCQGDLDPFPGTMWVADYGANCIYVLSPEQDKSAWAEIRTPDASAPEARHECSFVEAAGKFHLIGGRGVKAMDVFDPATHRWTKTASLPDSMEFNHAQAVAMEGKIFLGMGLTGPFPEERSVPNIYVYDASAGQWAVRKDAVPQDRRRGSSGAVAYGGRIYFVGGTTHGHASGSVPWLDAYDPATGIWTKLKDAPHARDHFQAVAVEGRIYAIGGRRSNQAQGRTFEDTEAAVDVYDIAKNEWTTLPASAYLPTPRGGATTVTIDGKIVVIGGESKQPKAHDQAEVFDVRSGKWSTLPSLKTGRHGTQAIVHEGRIIIAAGCGRQGGTPELNSMEVLTWKKDR